MPCFHVVQVCYYYLFIFFFVVFFFFFLMIRNCGVMHAIVVDCCCAGIHCGVLMFVIRLWCCRAVEISLLRNARCVDVLFVVLFSVKLCYIALQSFAVHVLF